MEEGQFMSIETILPIEIEVPRRNTILATCKLSNTENRIALFSPPNNIHFYAFNSRSVSFSLFLPVPLNTKVDDVKMKSSYGILACLINSQHLTLINEESSLILCTHTFERPLMKDLEFVDCETVFLVGDTTEEMYTFNYKSGTQTSYTSSYEESGTISYMRHVSSSDVFVGTDDGIVMQCCDGVVKRVSTDFEGRCVAGITILRNNKSKSVLVATTSSTDVMIHAFNMEDGVLCDNCVWSDVALRGSDDIDHEYVIHYMKTFADEAENGICNDNTVSSEQFLIVLEDKMAVGDYFKMKYVVGTSLKDDFVFSCFTLKGEEPISGIMECFVPYSQYDSSSVVSFEGKDFSLALSFTLFIVTNSCEVRPFRIQGEVSKLLHLLSTSGPEVLYDPVRAIRGSIDSVQVARTYLMDILLENHFAGPIVTFLLSRVGEVRDIELRHFGPSGDPLRRSYICSNPREILAWLVTKWMEVKGKASDILSIDDSNTLESMCSVCNTLLLILAALRRRCVDEHSKLKEMNVMDDNDVDVEHLLQTRQIDPLSFELGELLYAFQSLLWCRKKNMEKFYRKSTTMEKFSQKRELCRRYKTGSESKQYILIDILVAELIKLIGDVPFPPKKLEELSLLFTRAKKEVKRTWLLIHWIWMYLILDSAGEEMFESFASMMDVPEENQLFIRGIHKLDSSRKDAKCAVRLLIESNVDQTVVCDHVLHLLLNRTGDNDYDFRQLALTYFLAAGLSHQCPPTLAMRVFLENGAVSEAYHYLLSHSGSERETILEEIVKYCLKKTSSVNVVSRVFELPLTPGEVEFVINIMKKERRLDVLFYFLVMRNRISEAMQLEMSMEGVRDKGMVDRQNILNNILCILPDVLRRRATLEKVSDKMYVEVEDDIDHDVGEQHDTVFRNELQKIENHFVKPPSTAKKEKKHKIEMVPEETAAKVLFGREQLMSEEDEVEAEDLSRSNAPDADTSMNLRESTPRHTSRSSASRLTSTSERTRRITDTERRRRSHRYNLRPRK